MFRNAIALDDDIPEIEQIDLNSDQGAFDHFRAVLRTFLRDETDALHLFFNESSNCVQICLHWKDTWVQEIPVSGLCGVRLLRRLRGMATRTREIGVTQCGNLVCRHEGSKHHLVIESAHEWDVRVYRKGKRPRSLPYRLVFAGMASVSEPTAPDD